MNEPETIKSLIEDSTTIAVVGLSADAERDSHKVATYLREAGYTIIVTGDHGNIETMFYPDGEPNPSHGLNPVPFILISDEPRLRNAKLRQGKGLSSIAPTVLQLLRLEAPPEMTGESLIVDG